MTRPQRPFLVFTAVSIALCLVAAGGAAPVPVQNAPANASRRPTSRPAARPTATAFTASSIAQRPIRFPQDYRGKVVMVTFWASWCPYCRGELNMWKGVYARYRTRNFEMIGVNEDAERSLTQVQFKQFVQQNILHWPQIYDEGGQISKLYHGPALPTSWLVDGTTGRVLAAGQSLRGPEMWKTMQRFLGPLPGSTTTQPAKQSAKGNAAR